MFILSWMLFHVIDKESPLYPLAREIVSCRALAVRRIKEGDQLRRNTTIPTLRL
jgi:hypothetical protein